MKIVGGAKWMGDAIKFFTVLFVLAGGGCWLYYELAAATVAPALEMQAVFPQDWNPVGWLLVVGGGGLLLTFISLALIYSMIRPEEE